jgi:tetratricopeptide (TPR) repeat protein
LLLTIAARRSDVDKRVELPVKDPAFEPFLKSTIEFPADSQDVKTQAREIAGDDRDAWSVARKLADWTHKNLEWKQVMSASASQTLATREADCSEFSQLFVAMARSLGLPARMVSGLAYSGNSFGGHAWVEVWAGKWIELDPTWGTAFVDATHIRNTSNTLVMSAALDLIELEVVETRRTVSEFQKSSKGLTEHLLTAIANGERSELEAAIDLATLTDEFMGAGNWSKLSNAERDQMSSAYRRLLTEIIDDFSNARFNRLRLLYLDEKGDQAEATCLLSPLDVMLKLRLVRRHELWYLVEVLQADSAFYVASETLRPTITRIEKTRAAQKVPPADLSDFMRVLRLLNNNPAKAVTVVDSALKLKPGDKGLLLLKAFALRNTPDRKPEGSKLLRELSDQSFAPAVYTLANELRFSEDENEKKQAPAVFERYTSLEPRDPRGFHGLAKSYDAVNDLVKAEAAYRKVIELNPNDTDGYLYLINFLVLNDRLQEAKSALAAGEKYQGADEDLFGSVIDYLYLFEERPKTAEKFALSEPLRVKTSFDTNLTLGRIYSNDRRYVEALRVLEIAAQLDKKSTEPHLVMSMVYRKQSRWTAAIKAAQHAIGLDREESEAYYQLACALTRLGRTKEALAALSKSVELDEDQAEYIVDEPDLKRLASLPAFKKLLPQPVKQ